MSKTSEKGRIMFGALSDVIGIPTTLCVITIELLTVAIIWKAQTARHYSGTV